MLLITDAGRVLPDDEEEYETFLEILRDAGEAWGNGQAGMGARRATPFHVLFAVSEREKAKRAHWGMNEINAEPTREAGSTASDFLKTDLAGCACPTGASSWSCSASLSSGRVNEYNPVAAPERDGGVNRCLPAGFDIVAMHDTNPMRFSRIVERRFLTHQLGFPCLSAPRTDDLHR